MAFEESLEQSRGSYGFGVLGYVVMPEHVHLLVSEPVRAQLSTALQALKQSVARRLALRQKEPFWQARYYDFNVWSNHKRIEKLRYIHRNPVLRGLVAKPEEWLWSSYRHYQTGVEGAVEIESRGPHSTRKPVSRDFQVPGGGRVEVRAIPGPKNATRGTLISVWQDQLYSLGKPDRCFSPRLRPGFYS